MEQSNTIHYQVFSRTRENRPRLCAHLAKNNKQTALTATNCTATDAVQDLWKGTKKQGSPGTICRPQSSLWVKGVHSSITNIFCDISKRWLAILFLSTSIFFLNSAKRKVIVQQDAVKTQIRQRPVVAFAQKSLETHSKFKTSLNAVLSRALYSSPKSSSSLISSQY